MAAATEPIGTCAKNTVHIPPKKGGNCDATKPTKPAKFTVQFAFNEPFMINNGLFLSVCTTIVLTSMASMSPRDQWKHQFHLNVFHPGDWNWPPRLACQAEKWMQCRTKCFATSFRCVFVEICVGSLVIRPQKRKPDLNDWFTTVINAGWTQ